MKRVLLVSAMVISSCGGQDGTIDTSQDPGALLAVTMDSTVGVLLDEVPASMRDRVASQIIAKGDDFWNDRAQSQVKLTTYRLVFRQAFYGNGTTRDALPLSATKSLWSYKFKNAAHRTTVKGHDLIVRDYTFSTTVLTDAASPGISEPNLKNGNGTWKEPFIFPIDPDLVFQRTRFACLDEAQFPPNSVDSEEVDSFYDQTCGVESELTTTGCHQTELPTLKCTDALDAKIGKVSTNMNFTHVKWDPNLANKVRVDGTATNPTGPDMRVVADEFHENRLTYRYIKPDSCTLVENCVGGAGWRRLLQFSTTDENIGASALNIGAVDYFMDGAARPLIEHGVYEFSACHEHYHFMHYGKFSFGSDAATTSKRGFCLQATIRYGNNEHSLLTNPYANCDFQGVGSGWADQYRAGLECQWVDVTTVNTSHAPVTNTLSFHSNPDGFLCEGTPVTDSSGNQLFEPTNFTTAAGQPVDRPECTQWSGWDSNNVDSYAVTLPLDGEGYVTAPCKHGQIGPLRNCGFTKKSVGLTCTPGQTVNLTCKVPSGSAPQVARICDYSAALQSGIPCPYQDSLKTIAVDSAGATVSFTCPAMKDANEPGGKYSLYTAPLSPDDKAATVTCN